jgi:hypothetical protein
MVDDDSEERVEDKLAEINQEVQQYNRNCSRTSGKAIRETLSWLVGLMRPLQRSGLLQEQPQAEETKRTGLQA